MSSCSRRRMLGLVAALPLAACGGFAPAFGPDAPARTLLGGVRIDDPTDKNAFDLVERLEERLGRLREARYALHYSINTSEVDLGITQANAITRYRVTGSVSYSLADAATQSVVSAGSATTFTSYSASGTTVATDASKAGAYSRLMRILADQIVARLTIDLGAKAAG